MSATHVELRGRGGGTLAMAIAIMIPIPIPVSLPHLLSICSQPSPRPPLPLPSRNIVRADNERVLDGCDGARERREIASEKRVPWKLDSPEDRWRRGFRRSTDAERTDTARYSRRAGDARVTTVGIARARGFSPLWTQRGSRTRVSTFAPSKRRESRRIVTCDAIRHGTNGHRARRCILRHFSRYTRSTCFLDEEKESQKREASVASARKVRLLSPNFIGDNRHSRVKNVRNAGTCAEAIDLLSYRALYLAHLRCT